MAAGPEDPAAFPTSQALSEAHSKVCSECLSTARWVGYVLDLEVVQDIVAHLPHHLGSRIKAPAHQQPLPGYAACGMHFLPAKTWLAAPTA